MSKSVRVLFAWASLLLVGRAFAADDLVTPDPSKVLGYATCQKCHGQEIEVWKTTPHFQTFRSLHRKPEAQEIAKRMGLRSIKRGDLCVKCHYTEQQQGPRVKAISGISCESCHGAAQDWLDMHSDYGGPTVTKEMEAAAHKQQRRETCMKLGMRNPANLYLIARSCFNCHSIPHEKLVNVGGHAAATESFELVAWSQGMVRHNFASVNGQYNATASRERLRIMYVVGLMTDLEYSLRATAKATHKAPFGEAMAWRVYRLRTQLAEIQESLQNKELAGALQAAYSIKLKSNNADALLEAANLVSQHAMDFATSAQGSSLSAVDGLIPPESAYKK